MEVLHNSCRVVLGASVVNHGVVAAVMWTPIVCRINPVECVPCVC